MSHALFLLLILALFFFEDMELARLRARWARVARGLGLRITQPSPELEMSGVVDGVEIEVRQVVKRHGKGRRYSCIVRACVTTVSLPSPPYRAPPSGTLSRAVVPVEVQLVDGWLEHRRAEQLFPHELQEILPSLILKARETAPPQT